MSRRSRRGIRRGYATMVAEAPLRVTGLKAWYDARSAAYMTLNGSAVSAWLSRAGSLGSVSFTQGTAANQPTYEASKATFNNKGVVTFDGSNDFLTSNNTNAWKFLHDGTGASTFVVRRIDSTGGATQQLLLSASTASEVGVSWFYSTDQITPRVANGSGTFLNNNNTGAPYGARDVTAWQSMSYIDGTFSNARSGGTTSGADAVGQDPSTANPTRALILGSAAAAANPLKGSIAQLLLFDHVLTAGERSALAAWANGEFGVAA